MEGKEIPAFVIFGSEDSLDYDVMAFVDKLQDPHSNKMLCNELDERIAVVLAAHQYPAKKVNTNLAVVKGNRVVEVFKGTADEVNNSLYRTCDLHKQLHETPVRGLVERDLNLKVLRTFRVLLSHISRTSHREVVKAALKADLFRKIAVVEGIPLATLTDLGEKGIELVEYHKMLAFQLAQTLALVYGHELYSKQSVIANYPDLKPFLLRKSGNVAVLQKYQNLLVDAVLKRKHQFTKLYE